MKKFILGSAFALAFLVAGSAQAANISAIKFDNGQTKTSCQAGDTVNVTFRVTVPVGEVAELGQVDVLGDSLAPALPIELGGELGLQEGIHDVDMEVTCPQNTQYYDVELRTAGIYGGQRAVVMTDGVTSVQSFNNAIRVTATGAPVGETSGWQAAIAALTAQIQALLHPTPAPTPTPTPATGLCAQLASAMVGAQYGVRNSANVTLQGFLLYQHESIPALAEGASFGLWLNQTQAAVMHFKSVNQCN